MPSDQMAQEATALKPLRPPGPSERYFITRNYLRFYNSVGNVATYSVPSRLLPSESGQEFFESVVLTALGTVLQRHASLGVGIRGEETLSPQWTRVGNKQRGRKWSEVGLGNTQWKTRVKWSEVVNFLNVDVDGDKWVEDAHQVPFDRVEELPLWRVFVTRKSPEKEDGKIRFRVGFFFHHAIGDGISGGAFHITLRDALNALLDTDTAFTTTIDDEIIFPPNLELIPNLEKLHPLPVSFCFVAKSLLPPPKATSWKGPDIKKVLTRAPITRIKAFSLDNSTTTKLVNRCREEKSTMTSLISLLIARNLAEMYPHSRRFSGLVPFSLRRYTKNPDDEIVLQVTTNAVRFTKDPNDKDRKFLYLGPSGDAAENLDWQVVGDLKKIIDKGVKPNNQLISLLRHMKDMKTYMKARLGTKRDASFEMSNIGVIDGGNGKGEISFEKMMFSASMNVFGAPYSFCVCSAKGGDMTVTLNWEEGVVTREEAEGFSRVLEKQLRKLAEVK